MVGYGGWRAIYPPPIGTKSCHPHVLIIGRTHPYRVALVSTYDNQQLILCFISQLERDQRVPFAASFDQDFCCCSKTTNICQSSLVLTQDMFQLDHSVLHLFGNISSVVVLMCPLHHSIFHRSNVTSDRNIQSVSLCMIKQAKFTAGKNRHLCVYFSRWQLLAV